MAMHPRSDITVISPHNDGESRVIVEICRRLGVDLRVSTQPWGATLDREPRENLQNLRPAVAVVEMPSATAEQQLASRGHQVIIIDHHYYPNLGLDRRAPKSSLEQVADLLDYKLDRRETAVAINDRAYIFGLLDAGCSINEILQVRQFDLEAQGIPRENIETVKKVLEVAPVYGGITVLRLDFVNAGFAQDFLVLQDPSVVHDLLILGGNPVRKVQFYGDPKKVDKLADIGEWVGGGGKSAFWGTNNPDIPEIFRRLDLPAIDLQG
jgi:hypothetical protein